DRCPRREIQAGPGAGPDRGSGPHDRARVEGRRPDAVPGEAAERCGEGQRPLVHDSARRTFGGQEGDEGQAVRDDRGRVRVGDGQGVDASVTVSVRLATWRSGRWWPAWCNGRTPLSVILVQGNFSGIATSDGTG